MSDDFPASSDTTGVVLVDGTPTTGTLEVEGDRDWFRFTVLAGADYAVTLDGDDAGPNDALSDPYLRIVQEDGEILAQNDDSGPGLNSALTFSPTQSGDLYVSVAAFDDSYSGDYVITIDETVPVPPTGISGTMFLDGNQNLVLDAGEAPIGGLIAFVDANQNGLFDADETASATNADGTYEFMGLAPGTYQIGYMAPPGFTATGNGPSIAQGAGAVMAAKSAGPAASSAEIAELIAKMTLSGSDAIVRALGIPDEKVDGEAPIQTQDVESNSLINLNEFHADPRFAGLDGSGFSVVVLDTGIDADHPFFGPDSDNDGTADRIVYAADFTDSPSGTDDMNGHGTHVSSVAAGLGTGGIEGPASGAGIIHLKVLGDDGFGSTAGIEAALQWVADNVATYNIAAVNLSLGDSSNETDPYVTPYGDEFAAITAQGVIVASAAGNDYFSYQTEGVSSPAVDINSLAVGAVYDANIGSASYGDGSTAFTTGADRITVFSQRDTDQTEIFAPGAAITGARAGGGTASYHGTSQATPVVAGVATVIQELAQREMGRNLSLDEFRWLVHTSGAMIVDGDDEDDNATNTGETYRRLDIMALAEAVMTYANGSVVALRTVTVENEEITTEDVGLTAANDGPSVSLINTVEEVDENGSTDLPVRVATIVIEDDGVGENNLTLSGADADVFEITGGNLYLKAGVVLDFETQSSYAVTVEVDDPALAPDPDDTADFTLSVGDIDERRPNLVAGGPRADDLFGTNGDDVFFGLGGRDTFQGFAGDDTVHGGFGNDTAVYDGEIGDFVFGSPSLRALTVSDTVGDEGTDRLIGVERIEFADVTVRVRELERSTTLQVFDDTGARVGRVDVAADGDLRAISRGEDGTWTRTLIDGAGDEAYAAVAATFDGSGALLSREARLDDGSVRSHSVFDWHDDALPPSLLSLDAYL